MASWGLQREVPGLGGCGLWCAEQASQFLGQQPSCWQNWTALQVRSGSWTHLRLTGEGFPGCRGLVDSDVIIMVSLDPPNRWCVGKVRSLDYSGTSKGLGRSWPLPLQVPSPAHTDRSMCFAGLLPAVTGKGGNHVLDWQIPWGKQAMVVRCCKQQYPHFWEGKKKLLDCICFENV